MHRTSKPDGPTWVGGLDDAPCSLPTLALEQPIANPANVLLGQDGSELSERLRGRVVQRPDHRLSREDGERYVGPVRGYVGVKGLGRVGEPAAAQQHGEIEDIVEGRSDQRAATISSEQARRPTRA